MNQGVTVGEIARWVSGVVVGDPGARVVGAASFEEASPKDITYAVGKKFLGHMTETNAGAVIVPHDFRDAAGKNLICTDNPKLAFIHVVQGLHPPPEREIGIHPGAVIGAYFSHGADISLGPQVCIGRHVKLGDRVTLQPGVVLGDFVELGDDVQIGANVSILAGCKIGCRVTIHAGTVIGSDGFGYVPDGMVYRKIPHRGYVQIDDDVEIGACNTIDRGTFGRTWIQRGVKTDNLVHVAHNVVVGENTLLVAQVGIAGSTTIGKNVVLAGKSGITGHVHIGDHVIVGPGAGVTRSLEAGQVVSGLPEMPHRQWLKVQRIIARLPDLKKRISLLEKKLLDRQDGSRGET